MFKGFQRVATAIALSLCFLGSLGKAQVRLFAVHSEVLQAPLILPVKAQETPEAALERYLKGLERSADLMELFSGTRPFIPVQRFEDVTQSDLKNKTLLMANLPKDYTRHSLRVENFIKLFKVSQLESFILPIASSLGLSLTENQEYLKMISDKFPFLVAMGGDDVDPAKYKQDNMHSRNVIPERDRFEIQMIKAYTQKEKGFLLGVCRGSQISSVALGYSLHQHVPLHIGTEVAHGNDWHDIKTFKTEHNILSKLAGEKGTLHINSLHHQSIRFTPGGPLSLAAVSEDGVTEALEFKNGRGILLQFHPELMGNKLGEQIITEVVKQKSRMQFGSCGKIFN